MRNLSDIPLTSLPDVLENNIRKECLGRQVEFNIDSIKSEMINQYSVLLEKIRIMQLLIKNQQKLISEYEINL